jgi:trans-2,3-dihydro-3-hydroxyanthranilate isomerase
MPHRFVIADVFTETAFGGNQLAVFPDGRGLSDRAMQALAREFNFAETTFVLPPQDPRHARRVRIFTPKAELPFAGHPTVGTAAVLARLGLVPIAGGAATIVLEEGIGPIAVEIKLRGETVFAHLVTEKEVESPSARPARSQVAAALSLPEDAVLDTWFAGMGVRFCFVHLASREAVDRAVLDRAAWSAHFAKAWSPQLYFFAGRLASGSRLYVRMFAPPSGSRRIRPPAPAPRRSPGTSPPGRRPKTAPSGGRSTRASRWAVPASSRHRRRSAAEGRPG